MFGFFRNVRNGTANVRCLVRLPSGDAIQDFQCTGLDVHRGFQRHRKFLFDTIGRRPDDYLKQEFWPLTLKLVLDISSARSVATSGDLARAEAATCFLIECGFTQFANGDLLQVVTNRKSEIYVQRLPKTGAPDAVALGNYARELRRFQDLVGLP